MKEFKTSLKSREANKRWRQANKAYFAEYQRNYNSNEINKLIHRFREVTRRIKNKIIQNNKAYASDSACLLITGMNFAMLKFHLVQKFVEKHGFAPNLAIDCEIDHIVPLATAQNEEELRQLLRFNNLQLVLKSENRLKMQQDRQVIKFCNPKPRKPFTKREVA